MRDRGTCGDLGVDEILDLLFGAADVQLGPGTVSQLDHALQTASLLAHAFPGQDDMAVAGLLHDIGHLLPGVSDEGHADAGADAIRAVLGERVAVLVSLHVEAKRYLVTTQPEYRGVLASDSTASLAHQGGTLNALAVAAFRARPLADAALALRRADDRAKTLRAGVEPLEYWVPLLRELSHESGRSGS